MTQNKFIPKLVPLASSEPTSGLVLEGFRYWEKLRGARNYPSAGEIDFSQIPNLQPYVSILEICEDGNDFLFEIFPDGVLNVCFGNYEGRMVSQIGVLRAPSTVHSIFYEAASTKKPVCVSVPYAGPVEGETKIDSITFPLSDDGVKVNKLMAVIDVSHIVYE